MITKERLEELIEKGATIYFVGNQYWDNSGDWKVVGHKLTKTRVKDLGGIVEISSDKRFFETKEDAEEYAEFGNITRTEKLELPSWEENLQCAKIIYGTQNDKYNNYCFQYELLVCKNEVGVLQLYPESKELFWEKKTRENYNKARRLCKKLFLGEDVCEK